MAEALPRTLQTRLRIGAVILVALLLALAHHFGLLQLFADPAQTKRTLISLGTTGYAAFLLAYTLLQPFGVPGTVFVMAAPLIWPWPVAFALSMIGTMSASVVGFSFARFVARDWVTPRIPERFRKYNTALQRSGFTTVATLRFLLWMPPLLHAFFGVSEVPFWTHFWGSMLGYVLPLLAVSYFGQALFDLLWSASTEFWVTLVGVNVTVAFAVLWMKRRRRQQRAALIRDSTTDASRQ